MPATHHSSAPPTSSSTPSKETDKSDRTNSGTAGKNGKNRKNGKNGKNGKDSKKTTGPGTAADARLPAPEGSSATEGTAVGRIPVLDVRPVVQHGRRPAKAVVGETFEISATVFREGHDAVAANVVLRDPEGRPGPFTPMRELAPGTDRWGADVTPDAPGMWTYSVEAWGDPVATWRHHARIKVPAG
ncbi:maltotransferase domain-containing protein, partial [Streptomyces sp. NPDC001348]